MFYTFVKRNNINILYDTLVLVLSELGSCLTNNNQKKVFLFLLS